MTDERFEELLAAFLEDDISREDLAALHQAVHASDDRRRRFAEESRLHVMMREALVEQAELQSLHQAWSPGQTGKSPSRIRVLTVVAAAIILVLVLAGTWLFLAGPAEGIRLGVCFSSSGSGQVRIERGGEPIPALPASVLRAGDRVITGVDAQAMLRLEDGSMLSMEPESCLTLTSQEPQVKLEKGEALFEIVQRPSGKPAFRVVTGQSTVDVLGTIFSLKAGEHTRLEVYEGTVVFTRHHDQASVQVDSEQMATTEAEALTARNLLTRTPARPVSIVSLLPTDDAILDNGERDDGRHLKVEGRRRIAYLRYVIPPVGTIRSARLRLTQDVDTGSGTLLFCLGEHAAWTENDLTGDRAPAPLRELARRTGVVQRRDVVEVDISEGLPDAGPITIVITLNKGAAHDIWFGSRESELPPQLILTYTGRHK